MDKLLINLGLKRSPDGDVIEGLQFRTWHSWAAGAIAVGVIVGLHQLWP